MDARSEAQITNLVGYGVLLDGEMNLDLMNWIVSKVWMLGLSL